jgi:hypothetical protein
MTSKINRNTIFVVVLYGTGTWSVIFMEEHRLMVFETRVLREIFGLERDGEKRGEWRGMHNEQLRGLQFSKNIIRVIKQIKMR